eukprot:Rhum_TRINITY_DN14698_c16_g1::Rhum_TRINITY_DN14698_c16_g1_i1::g.110254::m.110254
MSSAACAHCVGRVFLFFFFAFFVVVVVAFLLLQRQPFLHAFPLAWSQFVTLRGNPPPDRLPRVSAEPVADAVTEPEALPARPNPLPRPLALLARPPPTPETMPLRASRLVWTDSEVIEFSSSLPSFLYGTMSSGMSWVSLPPPSPSCCVHRTYSRSQKQWCLTDQ